MFKIKVAPTKSFLAKIWRKIIGLYKKDKNGS